MASDHCRHPWSSQHSGKHNPGEFRHGERSKSSNITVSPSQILSAERNPKRQTAAKATVSSKLTFRGCNPLQQEAAYVVHSSQTIVVIRDLNPFLVKESPTRLGRVTIYKPSAHQIKDHVQRQRELNGDRFQQRSSSHMLNRAGYGVTIPILRFREILNVLVSYTLPAK